MFSCTVDTEVYTFVILACNSWEFRNNLRKQVKNLNGGRNFWVVLDVKKETNDDKYIDDEKEKNLDEARHLKKLTVDDA